jgi:hypothetical protein
MVFDLCYMRVVGAVDIISLDITTVLIGDRK